MKILMVNKFLYPNGGSETYIFKLGNYLQSLGHEVQYFGMEHQGRCVGNHARQYTQDMDFHGGSRLSKLTYPLKTIYSGDAKKKMLLVLEDFAPDAVHLNNFNYQLTPSVICAVREYEKKQGKKIQIIYTAHDYQLICPNHLMYSAQQKPCEKCVGGKFSNCAAGKCIHGSLAKSIIGAIEGYFWKQKRIYACIDTIICPTVFIKSKLDTNPLLKTKTVVLHNFVDTVPKKDVQKEDYVLYFGRYSKEKGIETILKAKNIPFICAGSGPMEEEINQAGHIQNVGFQSGEALEMLIRKARLSVCPSECYENCPFSVMESIMYGTPVVGADIGGIPELIDDGKTGILFESTNVKAFESAVQSILKNKEQAAEMSRNCLNKKFNTIEEYCRILIQIYGGEAHGTHEEILS